MQCGERIDNCDNGVIISYLLTQHRTARSQGSTLVRNLLFCEERGSHSAWLGDHFLKQRCVKLELRAEIKHILHLG